MEQNITIIGGGNMGQAIARGLLSSNVIAPERLTIANPSLDGLEELRTRGVVLETDNRKAIGNAGVVIVAVKPKVVPDVLKEIANALQKNALLISVSAGISVAALEEMTSKDRGIVRVMPNVCATIGESMSVWVKNASAASGADTVREVLRAIGKEIELGSDEQIDNATAISGSGPAYVFHLAEVMIAKAQKLGLSETMADELVKQTFLGSALVLAEGERSPKELRDSVTSPGGTTEAALKEFDRLGVARALEAGIEAAAKRAKALGQSKE